jgi:hypothetical protein
MNCIIYYIAFLHLQIQFSLIDVMLMRLRLRLSNTNILLVPWIRVNPYIGEKGSLFRVSRDKLQIQFSLIDVMLMGLKLSLSNTNKYITGTLNKGQPLHMGKGRKRGVC